MRTAKFQCKVRAAVPLLLWLLPPLAKSSDAEVLHYTVRAEPFGVELTRSDGTKDTRHPRRESSSFCFNAERNWPVPAGPDVQRVRCEIRWSGFPANWRLVNSFGVDRRIQRLETTLGELRKAVFAGGDFRIARSRKNLLLVTRTTWKFSDTEALDLLDRIAEAQTAIWRDRGLAGHLVFLLATNESAGHWQGEARTHSTVLQVSRNTAEPTAFAQGLAHELFHEWNPRRLNRPDDERLYWFTEGVTDYYATITLWRSGIWDFERVLNNFNAIARTYFASPVRNLTAARMVEQRRSSSNAERLPYLQGYLLATHWNADGRILDQGMRNLMKSNREPLSNRRIAVALRAAGIPNASGEIERFVMQGETIVLRPRIWADCAAESTVDVRQFDIGFDLDESRKTGTVRGVTLGSNAWQAGVRDGQHWAPLDVAWGDPGYLADLEITDAQGTRRAKYYPAAVTSMPAPQYSPTSSTPCVLGTSPHSSTRR